MDGEARRSSRLIRALVYALAGLVLVAAILGLRASTDAVTHYAATLEGGVPAVVYEPGPPRGMFAPPSYAAPVPAVVLAHGFTGVSAK